MSKDRHFKAQSHHTMLTDINVLKISDRCKHWNLDFANLLDRGHCALSENQASNKDRNKKFILREEAEKKKPKRLQMGVWW